MAYPTPPVPNYVDQVGPVITSAEMNWLDQQARAAGVGLSNPVTIAQGGTQASNAPQALANLGGITAATLTATAATGALVVYPQTLAETAADVTPVNYNYPPGDIRRYGAVGDGMTDDTAAFALATSIDYPITIPYTNGNGYKITSTVTFAQNVTCNGQLYAVGIVSNSGESSGSWTGTNPAVHILNVASGPNAGARLIISGLIVEGDTNAISHNTIGILVDGNDHVLTNCGAAGCGFGIVNRSFSTQFFAPACYGCGTNIVNYAPSSSAAINNCQFFGGRASAATTYSMTFGDTRWASTVSSGNTHGVDIIVDGVDCEQAPMSIDQVGSIYIRGTHNEFSSTAETAILLGGSGQNNLRGCIIEGCYFSGVKKAIKCLNSVRGLKIRPNFYSNVTVCAVQYYDLTQGCHYEQGSATGSFANGQEVAYNFPGQTVNTITFNGCTSEADGIVNGMQYAVVAISKWFPGSWYAFNNSGSIERKINNSSIAGVYYTTPTTAIVGSVSSSVNPAQVQLTTASQAQAFNGGDAIAIATVSGGANASAAIVVGVDYVNGIITVDANATATGTVTISQKTVTTVNAV